MSLFAYDPQNSILIVAGYRVTQFADGTAITIEATDDDFKAHHGVRSAAWVKQKNKGFKLTFSVMGDSADNAQLGARQRLQKAGPSAPFPVMFAEINGTSKAVGTRGRFVKAPKIERGADMPKVEYTVECLDGSVNPGMML